MLSVILWFWITPFDDSNLLHPMFSLGLVLLALVSVHVSKTVLS
jgi:hypothetical protein